MKGRNQRWVWLSLVVLFSLIGWLLWPKPSKNGVPKPAHLPPTASANPSTVPVPKAVEVAKPASSPAPQPMAEQLGKSSSHPVNLGKVNLGIGKKYFTLPSGRTLAVWVMTNERSNALNMGTYPQGADLKRGGPTRLIGTTLVPGQPYTNDFGEGDIVTFTPELATEPNDLGEVQVGKGMRQQFTLASGRTLVITEDTLNPPSIDPNRFRLSMGIYNPGQALTERPAISIKESAVRGSDISGELRDGETFKFRPRF